MHRIIEAAIQQLPAWISVDVDGQLAWINHPVGLGYDASVLGRQHVSFVVEEDREYFLACVRRAREARETVHYAVRVLTPLPPGWAQIAGTMGPVVVDGSVVAVVMVTQEQLVRPTAIESAAMRFLLTPRSQKIVAFLLAGPAKGAAIGRHLNEMGARGQAAPVVRSTLAGLCERGILTLTRDGYAISPDFLPLARRLCSTV